MSVTKNFYVCPVTGDTVFEHRAVINGIPVVSQLSMGRDAVAVGQVPPMEDIVRSLRQRLESEIGRLLYKGVR